MNKKEYHRQINERFYAYVEENFPEYIVDSSEGFGRIYLIPKHGYGDSIEYHQSRHDLCCLNYASESTKENMEVMENYINNNIIPYVNLLAENLAS
jgi:hypothetical protein